jgi:hypothetical protein
MEKPITGNSTVVVVKDQVSADLSGEAAILNLKSGIYYGLDAVGARIWSLIQEPRVVSEIKDTILQEYDVEPKRCEEDLFALLGELLSHGLIEVKGEETP